MISLEITSSVITMIESAAPFIAAAIFQLGKREVRDFKTIVQGAGFTNAELRMDGQGRSFVIVPDGAEVNFTVVEGSEERTVSVQDFRTGVDHKSHALIEVNGIPTQRLTPSHENKPVHLEAFPSDAKVMYMGAHGRGPFETALKQLFEYKK